MQSKHGKKLNRPTKNNLFSFTELISGAVHFMGCPFLDINFKLLTVFYTVMPSLLLRNTTAVPAISNKKNNKCFILTHEKKNHQQSSAYFFGTIFGTMALIWSEYKKKPAVSQIFIPKPEISTRKTVSQSFPGRISASCPEIDMLINQIKAYLSGEDVRFSLDILRMDRCTSFQEKVLRTEFAIPRGRVSSYGLIAKHMNKPGAARAVGTALATNLFPIVIPCHRAIRSDGHLGGYQGGLPMKRQLLQVEGVKFYDKNHLSTKTFYYLNEH